MHDFECSCVHTCTNTHRYHTDLSLALLQGKYLPGSPPYLGPSLLPPTTLASQPHLSPFRLWIHCEHDLPAHPEADFRLQSISEGAEEATGFWKAGYPHGTAGCYGASCHVPGEPTNPFGGLQTSSSLDPCEVLQAAYTSQCSLKGASPLLVVSLRRITLTRPLESHWRQAGRERGKQAMGPGSYL